MSQPYYRYFLLFAIFAYFVPSSVGISIQLSLKKYSDKTEIGQAIYHEETLDPEVENSIALTDIPELLSFAILQVHGHERNLSISYNDSTKCNGTRCTLYGANLGLVAFFGQNSTASFVVINREDKPISALFSVVAYDRNAPMPGGCNMEFDFEVSPFQKLQFTDATVTLEAQPASAPRGIGPLCESPSVKLRRYRMFLPEREFKQETYFSGIQKMTTVQSILENGEEILPALDASSVRRVFSAYPGTGSIYAMIATYGNHSSAYVPAVSYACSPLSSPSSCGNLNTKTAQALCAIVLIVGLIVAFIGHKCLGFEVVFLGAISGGIISFAVLTAIGYFQTSTILGIVMGVSFLSGIGWLVLSCWMGMPCLATFLSSLTLGFFVASTVYFGLADDTSLFESDLNFWLIYVGITLLVPIVLGLLPFVSNVVCCAILGSYTIILPIDYYAGSNLKYIVINTIRRATVPEFNAAVIRPPYQSTDKTLVAFIIIIALVGIYVQVSKSICCFCSGKNSTTVHWNEREPIISSPRRGRRVLVFRENDRVEHHRSW
ncbi:transmembrane 7 superfamily member 3-like [Venturia canescens]|uniref:transmembrane 7 superfamily member 3-like n=1 Tax=Venturia canescens TaxID=32260 RepID=UPI001C9D0112|nr:transmembrane 7 superfamily member 3-like [Venturia canescens]